MEASFLTKKGVKGVQGKLKGYGGYNKPGVNKKPAGNAKKPNKGFKKEMPKDPEECIKLLAKDGLLIRNIEVQTEDMCIAAVRQNGLALKFIKNRYKTPKICVIAVGQNGLALKHANKQDEKICVTAVKQNPMAMEYVEEKTEEIREIARKRYNDWLSSLK